MKSMSQSILTLSAVAFIASLLVDLYLFLTAPTHVGLIIAVSLILLIDTYFFIESIINKVDEISSISFDKQNELTKVEKGIYAVAKREERSRTQSMSAILDVLLDLKDENQRLQKELMEQDKLLTKLSLKKNLDNTTKIVNSNERLAVLIAQMATANAKSQTEALEILNDICKELEERNGKYVNDDYSNIRMMRSKVK